jgi:hypothetical protein
LVSLLPVNSPEVKTQHQLIDLCSRHWAPPLLPGQHATIPRRRILTFASRRLFN